MSSYPQLMPNIGYSVDPYRGAMLQYLAAPQQWNTPLAQNQVQPYQQWLMQNAPMGDIIQGDKTDYDYQGAFLAGLQRNLASGQHFTDQFKKPNHPTFSNESFNPLGFPAGRWQENNYLPSSETHNTLADYSNRETHNTLADYSKIKTFQL